MPRKPGIRKPAVQVMESLSNAVEMFQIGGLNMLATDNNIAIPISKLDTGALNRKRQEQYRGLRPPSTIMCPW